MRNLIRTVVAVLALVGVAALLNPSPEAHRARIKEKVAERSPLAGLLRLGDLQAFVSSYHSVVVGSYTTANDRVLSVGAFGLVVVLTPAEDKPR